MSPASETTQANPSEKLRRILPKVATSTSRSLTCRKFTTWDRRLYFPSEGRRAEDFFARKIRRLRPGLNPRTRVPKASTLTSRPPKPLLLSIAQVKERVDLYPFFLPGSFVACSSMYFGFYLTTQRQPSFNVTSNTLFPTLNVKC